jgi:glycosyltransferase involved in cell wall biosynthesis
MPLISIVSPVYNEALGIQSFCNKIIELLNGGNYDFEIILCTDPSTDGTEEIISTMHLNDPRVKLVSFSRRVGQDKATQAGLDFAQGDAVIVMDCDLQDPIETIPKFILEWEKGAKVVYARRTSRKKENPIKRISANLFYRVLRAFSDVEIPRDAGDFRLMDKCVVIELRKYREDSFFLRAVTPLVGFLTTEVEIARQPREAGETKYNRYFGGVKAAMVAIYGYTNLLQKIFLVLAFFFLSSSGIFTLILFTFNFEANHNAILYILVMFGFSTMFLVSFLGWILTSYLDRIYKQSLRRPNYTVARRVGFDDSLKEESC